MIGAKINIHYVDKGSKCIKVLCEDLADMQKTISELSMKPGVQRVVLNDYATISLEEEYHDPKCDYCNCAMRDCSLCGAGAEG